MPSWAAGTAPESSVGPVTDASGLAHWIDIYRPVRHVRLVRTPGGDPFLTVSLRVPLSRIGSGGSTGPQTWQISAGSVWFASTLVAAAAPAGSFCGLAVTGGTLRFGQPVTVNNDEIVVPLAAQVDLNLDLAGATPITGTGPGGDARAAALTLPTTAQLTVTAAGGTLATPDTARLLAYGTDVIVTPSGEPARYDAAERVLVVPMQAQPDSFAISAVASALFVPAGTASISAAGWTIPAAVVPWASLGDAAGAGGITLWLEPGLTATWVGQSAAVALADSALQVTDGRLEISAPSATGDRVAVSPRLDGLVGARLHLAWDEQFPLTFISGASGAEVLLTDADLSAALPKPVDLGGQPIPVESHDATVALLARVSGTELLVLGALSRPHVPRKLVSFGLVNAVLTATYPQDVSILGGYDGTVLSPATIDLTYTLESIIPTLPDPYASSAGSLRSSTSRAGGALHSTLHWDASSGTLEFRLPGSDSRSSHRPRASCRRSW
jgi:hypothetical protein